jgi:hypothetical protein
MIKIGDKVKFDTYLPYNYMNDKPILKKLSDKRKITNRQIYTVRLNNISKYCSNLISDTIQEGIFVGTFRKKLIRSYYRTEPTDVSTSNIRLEDVDFEEVFIPATEFATNVRRRGSITGVTRESITREPGRPHDWSITLHTPLKEPINILRYSKNPRRIDDPRSLDKIAMLKVNNKLIGVPMTNIYKCNFDNTFKVI